jgi:hypothetical protein
VLRLADGVAAGAVGGFPPVWVFVVCVAVQRRHFSHQLKVLSFTFLEFAVPAAGGVERHDLGLWERSGRLQFPPDATFRLVAIALFRMVGS